MCNYFKKVSPSTSYLPPPWSQTNTPQLFTCGHLSRVYIDRCLLACTPGNEACTSTSSEHDPVAFAEKLRQEARHSHFICFECITKGVSNIDGEADNDLYNRPEILAKQTQLANKAAKAEANRLAAAENMRVERERDRATAEAVKAEKERAARGEGAWQETGSVRKKKGKHGRGFPSPVQSAPPTPTLPMGAAAGVGGRADKMGEFRKDEPRSANEADGGRPVGWPRKILTKGENQRGEKGEIWRK